MSESDWDGVFAVDLKAAWLTCKHVLPHLMAKPYNVRVNAVAPGYTHT